MDLDVPLVSPDLVVGEAAASEVADVVVGVVVDGEGEAGVVDAESVGAVVVYGVPVAGVVEPSAAGVVPGASGFLNASSQVWRT